MNELLLWSEVGQWTLLAVLCALVSGLVYIVVELRRRIGPGGALMPTKGLEVGSQVPPLDGIDARTGRRLSLPTVTGRQWLVVFLSPTCAPCVELARPMNEFAARERNTRVVAVVKDGKGYDFASELTSRITVLRDTDGALTNAYEATITPLMYLVDAEGKVRVRTVPNTRLELDDTLDALVHEQGASPWVPQEP